MSKLWPYLAFAILAVVFFTHIATSDGLEENIYSVGLSLLFGIFLCYEKLDDIWDTLKGKDE